MQTGKAKLHYSWIICASCTLAVFCTGGLAFIGFSVYQPYLLRISGLSNTQLSFLTTTRSLAALAAMAAAGPYLKKLGLRRGIGTAVLLLAAAFALLSWSQGYAVCLTAFFLMGLSYGLGCMVPVPVLLDRWFYQNRTLALGISTAASGVSSLLGAPVIAWVVNSFSLQAAFLGEMIFILVCGMLQFVLLRDTPAEKNTTPLGELPKQAARRQGGGSASRGQWMFVYAAALLLGTANTGALNYAALYSLENLTAGQLSLLASIMGFAVCAGKCLYGWLTDRAGSYRSGNLFFIFMLVGLTGWCFAGQGGMLLAVCSVFVFGLGSPLITVGVSAVAHTISAEWAFAANNRRLQTLVMLGSLLFGPVPGLVADHAGSYVPAFRLILLCTAVSALVMQRVIRKNSPTA